MSLPRGVESSHPLGPKLKRLGLSGMLATLEVRAAEASREQLRPTEFLALLVDDELDRREQNRLRLRLREAGREEGKTLARFDFSAVPALNGSLVLELATCAFLERRENLLICGPTGVGKSHLLAGLAFEAIKRGHRVLLRPIHRVLQELHAGRADGSFARRLAKLGAVDWLILDDFGLRALPPQAIDDLYEIITQRYERRSLGLSSNRALEEWPEVFGSSLLASAALDRLTHHATTLIITGRSYRQRDRRKEGEGPGRASAGLDAAAGPAPTAAPATPAHQS